MTPISLTVAEMAPTHTAADRVRMLERATRNAPHAWYPERTTLGEMTSRCQRCWCLESAMPELAREGCHAHASNDTKILKLLRGAP